MLIGQAPNMIESGAPEFDMKPGLLNGPNAKTSKSGTKYNTVPFRIGTPEALPENFNGGIMPEEIYEVVKKKDVNPVSGKSSGLSLDEIPKKFQEPQKKQVKHPSSKSFEAYQHKHSVYEGIRKEKDLTTGQNSYTSFRRVSENSPYLAWIYPGIPAKDIAGKALEDFDIPSETGRAIDKFLADR